MPKQKTTFLFIWSLIATLFLGNITYPLFVSRYMTRSLSVNSSLLVPAVVAWSEHEPNGSIHAGETERLKKAKDELPWLSHPLLPRLLSRQEHDHCIDLLFRVDAILREFNITYMLAYGTLLGSYMMHDMLPWDDDLDIVMNIDDLPKMKRLFNASGSGHYKQIQLCLKNKTLYTAKLYWLSDPNAGRFPWHWPIIDILFYKENAQFVYFHKHGARSRGNRGLVPCTQSLNSPKGGSPRYAICAVLAILLV